MALSIHYYEAILACLAILIWHFYHVIFDPDVYPLSWACWKGKVSKEWQQEERPGGAEFPTNLARSVGGYDGQPLEPVIGNNGQSQEMDFTI